MKDEDKNKLADLVIKACKRDRQAMSELVELIQDDLFAFCFYLSSDKSVADDLCQEVLIKVLTKIQSLKNPKSFKSWVFKTAKNLYINYKLSPRVSRSDSIDDNTQGASYDIPEYIHDIAKALSFLDPKDKMALLLIDYHGYSYTEAADIIGISEAALTSRIYRIRQEFVKKFENS